MTLAEKTTVSPRPQPAAAHAFLDVCGVRLAVSRRGRGPAVLCLHATGHGRRDYDRLAAALAHAYEFISVDFPGHGESGPDLIPASAQRYGALAMAVADALGLDRFIILGNSIGGAAAIECASGHPERVRALTLCNPGGLERTGLIARAVCAAKVSFFASGERGDPAFAVKFRRYYERSVLVGEAARWRREEIIGACYQTASVLRQAWESFTAPSADLRGRVSRLSMPVLYAWAKRDSLVSWNRSKSAALRAPHCQVALFDAGHCAFLEQPEAFAAAFTAFAAQAPD